MTDLAFIDCSPVMEIEHTCEEISAADFLLQSLELPRAVPSVHRMDPYNIARERRENWPTMRHSDSEFVYIYNAVRTTGLPNMFMARVPLASTLKVENWRALASGHAYDHWLLDMLLFGFPLQYTGPALKNNIVQNHASANNFPDHIVRYINKETSENAMLGPMDEPPFLEWGHVNPIMTRPKSSSSQRRIIVDLSFPKHNGVNTYVEKNYVFGQYVPHTLPTVDQALENIRAKDCHALLGIVDIERAYRNFRVDPLDWPLSLIMFEDKYYLDLAMPFGARLSSLYMQKLAEFVVRALRARGYECLLYLDDLICVLPNDPSAHEQFANIMYIVRSLGLPINYNKLTPPVTQAVWLGVHINILTKTISIPTAKVNQLLLFIDAVYDKDHISYRDTQSLVGRIAHIARVIPAARLFMIRILRQLRESDGNKVFVTGSFRSDLKWFRVFFSRHNAVSLITNRSIEASIEADSSLVAGGARLGNRYYIYSYPPKLGNSHNICQLEAINYLVAMRIFVDQSFKGKTVELTGDNAGAIAALSSGRACDSVLGAVARAIWYHAAARDVRLVFTHKPGVLLEIADALSRAPLSQRDRHRADDVIHKYALIPVRVRPSLTNYQKYI